MIIGQVADFFRLAKRLAFARFCAQSGLSIAQDMAPRNYSALAARFGVNGKQFVHPRHNWSGNEDLYSKVFGVEDQTVAAGPMMSS